MNAVPIEPRNATTPVIQVSARLPRQAAIQNLPQRWITMKAKNSSTLHRCRELTKWPTPEVCHHAAPPMRQHAARGEDDDERRQREHAEDVDPRADVDRLPVGQRLPRWHGVLEPGAQPHSPVGPVGRFAEQEIAAGAHRGLVGCVVAVVPGEGEHQGQHEQQQHDADDDEVRDRDLDHAPVHVPARCLSDDVRSAHGFTVSVRAGHDRRRRRPRQTLLRAASVGQQRTSLIQGDQVPPRAGSGRRAMMRACRACSSSTTRRPRRCRRCSRRCARARPWWTTSS